MEIGNAFHEYPEDIAHISVRNVGVPWYMIEIADDPRFRAVHGIENMSARHWLQTPSEVDIPSKGDINFDLCLDQYFPSLSIKQLILSWRFVEPTRQQDDFGPTEWRFVDWNKAAFTIKGESCELRMERMGPYSPAVFRYQILRWEAPISRSTGNHKWGISIHLSNARGRRELLRTNDALSRRLWVCDPIRSHVRLHRNHRLGRTSLPAQGNAG